MKQPSPYICDYCGAQKAETNHWWLLIPPGRLIYSNDVWDGGIEFTTFSLLVKWNGYIAELNGVEHICGQECASKALSKWMENAAK